MADEKKDPFKIELSDQIRNQMAHDPEMGKAIMEFMGHVEAAKKLMEEENIPFDEAMFRVTGQRPEPVNPDELPDEVLEDIANAKITKLN